MAQVLRAEGRRRFFGQLSQALFVRSADDAPFGDDCRDKPGGSHIERRILYFHAFGRDSFTGEVCDLAWIALLDGNLAAVGSVEINRRKRGGDIKGIECSLASTAT